jgi:hypothetical protein
LDAAPYSIGLLSLSAALFFRLLCSEPVPFFPPFAVLGHDVSPFRVGRPSPRVSRLNEPSANAPNFSVPTFDPNQQRGAAEIWQWSCGF